jgi:hypothetical protein
MDQITTSADLHLSNEEYAPTYISNHFIRELLKDANWPAGASGRPILDTIVVDCNA